MGDDQGVCHVSRTVIRIILSPERKRRMPENWRNSTSQIKKPGIFRDAGLLDLFGRPSLALRIVSHLFHRHALGEISRAVDIAAS